MAHVEDRWYRPKRDPHSGTVLVSSRGKPVLERTGLHGKGKRYRVRYIDPDGAERSRSFPDRQKKQADNFLLEVESDKREGKYVDPRAGRVSFRAVAERWVGAQTFDYTTSERVESRIKTHLIPYFEGRSIGSIKPSDVQSWLRWLQDRSVAERSRVLYFTHLVSILDYAKEDKLVVSNPAKAKSVTRPRDDTKKVQPWPRERAHAVEQALEARYGPAVWLPVGIGLRQGEVFGFSLDDVDRARGVVLVQRQVRVVSGELTFAPPKRGKTREVPVGAALLDQLDDYSKIFPPVPITLPWRHPDGKPVTANLLMTDRGEAACRRQTFRLRIWRPALEKAGIKEPTRADGMHALRHLYASVLLDAGESIKALSEYLGHTDPGFTLRVYTHLMPSSHERTRRAVDGFFDDVLGTSQRDNDEAA